MYRILKMVLASLALISSLTATAPESFAQGYAPEEAVERMRVAERFEVQLVASEPTVRQPVCIEFDDRGRLWVIQCARAGAPPAFLDHLWTVAIARRLGLDQKWSVRFLDRPSVDHLLRVREADLRNVDHLCARAGAPLAFLDHLWSVRFPDRPSVDHMRRVAIARAPGLDHLWSVRLLDRPSVDHLLRAARFRRRSVDHQVVHTAVAEKP